MVKELARILLGSPLKKLIPGAACYILLGGLLYGPAAASANEQVHSIEQLQSILDQLPAGEAYTVPPGMYEGALVIRKPLQLLGSNQVTLKNGTGDSPVISIESDQVVLKGLSIEDNRMDPDSIAVAVRGDENVLEGLSIKAMGYGVRLNNADHNRLVGNEINGMTEDPSEGLSEEEEVERGNGIDLLESHYNEIRGNIIGNMFDGIYVEKGSGNRLEENLVTGSRYGYHLMFCKETVVQHNTGTRNVTGAMVMADSGAQIIDNDFAKQSDNATAQGILLFDVQGVLIEGNRIEGNRVGLYAQGITDNIIRMNRFYRNFVGLQMAGAQQTKIEGNEFVANVVQALAEAGQENRIAFNYWDTASGLDIQGDGISDLPYRSNPFFLTLTDQVPAYQLFFGSPGMLLLEGLFQAPKAEAFTDLAPWMSPKLSAPGLAAPSSGDWLWPLAAGLLLMGLSGSIYYIGGRKK